MWAWFSTYRVHRLKLTLSARITTEIINGIIITEHTDNPVPFAYEVSSSLRL